MTANDSKFYLSYLNKLVYQYNRTYYNSIGKKPINGDYSPLIEKIETTFKAPKFKVNNRATLLRIVLVKVTLKIGQEKHLLSILC